jgi:hypothetical protein
MFFTGSDPAGPSTLLSHFFLLFYFYADPGYGTLIWQLLLAGVFGGMFYFRRLKDFLSRRKRSGDAEQ